MINFNRIIYTISDNTVQTSKKTVDKVSDALKQTTDSVMKTVSDAQCSYGKALINSVKSPKWQLPDDQQKLINEIFDKFRFEGENSIDNEVSAFIVKNLYGDKDWTRADIKYSLQLFNKLQDMSVEKRNLIMNSEYFGLVFKDIKKHSFMCEFFDCSEKTIKSLDEIVKDKLTSDFALKYTNREHRFFNPEKLLEEVKPLQQFS